MLVKALSGFTISSTGPWNSVGSKKKEALDGAGSVMVTVR
jgi:hypothetical protein